MRKPDVDLAALTACLAGLFGTTEPLSLRRTSDGTSTQVYRLRRAGTTFYVRIAEEREASFAPEIEVHERLARAGVRVPEVVHAAAYDEELQRAVLVTTEIPGGPIDASTPEREITAIYHEAGHDLAAIHRVPVQGFGFVRRDHGRPGWPVRGEFPAYDSYVGPGQAGELTAIGFDSARVGRVERLLAEAIVLGPTDGVGALAHGDFDTTHVFGAGGRYAGIIDFGEIRGTGDAFDVATLVLNVDGPHTVVAERALRRGYAEARTLPDDFDRRLELACVLSTTHRLCTWLRRDGVVAAERPFFRWLAERLVKLTD